MAGKSYSIFYIPNKDITLILKIEDRKFKLSVTTRGKDEPEFTHDLKEDFMILLQRAFQEVSESIEPKTVSTVHFEYKDGGYKPLVSLAINKTQSGTFSLTILEATKGNFEFPIVTVAAVSNGPTPLKEMERSRLGMDKLMRKLDGVWATLTEASAVSTGFQKGPGNNFSQGGFNNTGNSGYRNQN